MNYLLCNQEFDAGNIQSQQQHYEQFHQVYKNNYFYRNLLGKDRIVFVPNECVGCDYFYLSRKDKHYHDFLQHYQHGGNFPFGAWPSNIKRHDGRIHYSISFEEHQEYYRFFDSDDTIINFIYLFELRFVPYDSGQIKCTFNHIFNLLQQMDLLRSPTLGFVLQMSIHLFILMTMSEKIL